MVLGMKKRLTGQHETAHLDVFTWGVGDRTAAVRLTTQSKQDGCGYFEVRTVGSNCDAWASIASIYDTIALDL